MKLYQYPLSFFEKKFKIEKDSKVKTRIQMIMHLREGYTQREVSKMLRASVGIVPYWKTRFEKYGIKGLQDKEGRGIKPKLMEELLGILGSAIADGLSMDNGYKRGFKTKDVNQFIREQFGYFYTNRHCRRLLTKMNMALIVPRPRNKRRNQKDVDKFLKEFKKNERVWVPI